MNKNYDNPNRFNIDITRPDLVKKCREYCTRNAITNKTLGHMALDLFFSNKRNQLMAMNKEQLVDIILNWEDEEDE